MMSLKDASNYQIEFRDQMIKFVDELIEQFPSYSEFVIFRIFLKNQMSPERLMKTFMKNAYPHKEDVYNKNDKVFEVMDETITLLTNEKKKTFQTLWKSDAIDDDDRDIIWQWMKLFTKLCDKYHKKFGNL